MGQTGATGSIGVYGNAGAAGQGALAQTFQQTVSFTPGSDAPKASRIIPYPVNVQISTSGITARVNGVPNYGQIFYFGAKQAYMAVSSGSKSSFASSEAHSTDAKIWHPSSVQGFTAGTGPTGPNPGGNCFYNGDTWLQLASPYGTGSTARGGALFSVDGQVWRQAGPTGINMFQGSPSQAVWNGTFWSIVGKSYSVTQGAQNLAISYDGVAIIPAPIGPSGAPLSLTGGLSSVAWNGLQYLAANASGLATGPSGSTGYTGTNPALISSYDGMNWRGWATTLWGSTAPTVPQTLVWTGSCWLMGGSNSFANGVFLAWSSDGLSWTPITGVTQPVLFIARGPVSTVVVCTDNQPRWSYDLVTWRSASPYGGGAVRALAYLNSCFVIASADYLWFSTDGGIWVTANTNMNLFSVSVFPDMMNDFWGLGENTVRPGVLRFAPNVRLAGGVPNGTYTSLQWSTDGAAWSSIQSADPFATTGTFTCTGLAYGNDTWIALGTTSYSGAQTTLVAVSKNGVLWDPAYGSHRLAASTRASLGGACCWTGALFLVALTSNGGSPTAAYSRDGYYWTSLGASVFPTATYGFCVGRTSSIVIALGSSNSGAVSSIAYSSNGGLSFTAATNDPFGVSASCAAWNGSIFVAGGVATNSAAYAPLACSSDGQSWTALLATNSIFSGGSPSGVQTVAWNNGVFLAGGGTSGGLPALALSYDGLTWTSVSTLNFPISGALFALLWDGGRWIAGGSGTASGASVAWSEDGVTWGANQANSGAGVTFPLNVSTLACPLNAYAVNVPGLCLAVGTPATNYPSSYAIAVSSNGGISWTGLYSPFSQGNGACWTGRLWIALGSGTGSQGTTNTLAYSNDGYTWRGLGSGVFTTAGYAAATNGASTLVAVGSGTNAVAISTNGGLAWSASTSPLTIGYSVFWTGLLWLAGGTGASFSIASSSTGASGSWTGVSSLLTACRGFASNGYVTLAVGTPASTNSPVIFSLDGGQTWSQSGVTQSQMAVANSVAWDGYVFLVVGQGGTATALYSTLPAIGVSNLQAASQWTVASGVFAGTVPQTVCWTSKRFLVGGTSPASVGSGGPLSFGNFWLSPLSWTASYRFTSFGLNVGRFPLSAVQGVASNPRVGPVLLDNQLSLCAANSNTSMSLGRASNGLEFFSESYFNEGFDVAAVSVQANSYTP